jgi:hypothetical protein
MSEWSNYLVLSEYPTYLGMSAHPYGAELKVCNFIYLRLSKLLAYFWCKRFELPPNWG